MLGQWLAHGYSREHELSVMGMGQIHVPCSRALVACASTIVAQDLLVLLCSQHPTFFYCCEVSPGCAAEMYPMTSSLCSCIIQSKWLVIMRYRGYLILEGLRTCSSITATKKTSETWLTECYCVVMFLFIDAGHSCIKIPIAPCEKPVILIKMSVAWASADAGALSAACGARWRS